MYTVFDQCILYNKRISKSPHSHNSNSSHNLKFFLSYVRIFFLSLTLFFFSTLQHTLKSNDSKTNQIYLKCLEEEKEEKDSEREVPNVTEKFFVTISRESPSPPSDVSLVVVV